MNRNIGMSILLSIITCGIYWYYWFYKLTEEVSYASRERFVDPALAIVFSILTCGLYNLYWCYKMGKLIYEAEVINDLRPNDESILYILLSVFGFDIIVFAILQSHLNKMHPVIQ